VKSTVLPSSDAGETVIAIAGHEADLRWPSWCHPDNNPLTLNFLAGNDGADRIQVLAMTRAAVVFSASVARSAGVAHEIEKTVKPDPPDIDQRIVWQRIKECNIS